MPTMNPLFLVRGRPAVNVGLYATEKHDFIEVLPAYRLPGVFGGRLTDLDLQADLRLVGGVYGDASGLVARTVDDRARVTISSIINRPGGPSANDLAYQEALVEMVDQLRPPVNFEAVEPDG